MRRREKRREEEEEEEEEGEDQKVCFVLESFIIWIPRVLVWRLIAPCSRVLWRDHINPRILEVFWEKP